MIILCGFVTQCMNCVFLLYSPVCAAPKSHIKTREQPGEPLCQMGSVKLMGVVRHPRLPEALWHLFLAGVISSLGGGGF